MIRLQHSDYALRRAQWLWKPRVEPLDPRVADGVTIEWLWMMWLAYRWPVTARDRSRPRHR